MEKKTNIGRLIEFKIKNQDESIRGILVEYSKEWTLLHSNPVDYVLDGLIAIKNSEITNHKIHSSNSLDGKILKKKMSHLKFHKLNIESSEKLFQDLNKKKMVFSITNYDSNTFKIGRIKEIDVKNRFIFMELLSPKATWSAKKKVALSEIQKVEYDTDYITSLLSVC